jgi:hypothetical protein
MPFLCDFCSEPAVTWRYPARNFVAYVVGNVGGESVGDWAACECCHSLIEAGSSQALTRRAVERLVVKHPELSAVEGELIVAMRDLHRSFVENRLGAALPLRD